MTGPEDELDERANAPIGTPDLHDDESTSDPAGEPEEELGSGEDE